MMFRCIQGNPVKRQLLFMDFLFHFCSIYSFLLLLFYYYLINYGVLNCVNIVSKQLITYLNTNKYIRRFVNGIYRLFPQSIH